MEVTVFVIAAVIVLTGGLGVILSPKPVHSALFLVMTLFGVAVHFILLDAPFLAAVQVIVYAGAIVILFLFVLMLLGVDRAEDLAIEPLAGQRPLAVVVGASIVGIVLAVILAATDAITGARAANEALEPDTANVRQLGRSLYTDHVVAFELTAVLLTIAVVGAIVFARRGAVSADPMDQAATASALDAAADSDLDRPSPVPVGSEDAKAEPEAG